MAKRKQTRRLHLEKELYPKVERWLKRRFRCFHTAIDKGLQHSRIDVVGLRDSGGDLSGQIEVIAVEVKRGASAFATASGQTLGYNVYANRIYLADVRETDFSSDELDIAGHLGIGLIRIRRGICREVLSSPFYQPMERLRLRLLENLRLGRCQLCGTFFQIGQADDPRRGYPHTRVSRENLEKALKEEKGLMFWNEELGNRKRKAGIRGTKEDDRTHERRFLCPDCVESVLGGVVDMAQDGQ